MVSSDLMRLADHYRTLDLDPGASFEEVKRAHRDLTKVWHPDRFAHDAPLRQKAEEKLKAINEAFAAIRDSHEGKRQGWRREESTGGEWRIRHRGREARFTDLNAIATLLARGDLRRDVEVFDPSKGTWVDAASVPQLREAMALARSRRNRGWAITCTGLAIFVLLRRPTPGGLLLALVLFGTAFVLGYRLYSDD